ncbi:MAG: polyprenyl synthetase family protein [Clostridia bacterium]|nr:polyprenyl synthetase family protein [Clostridia bacterium]
MTFEDQLNKYAGMVNDELNKVFAKKECLQKSVYDAMEYSILAGGKRIRPVLTLAVCDMLGGDIEDALKFAVAIECIHTYSLIHDDLPCMDDDDLRRGRSTCHKKFDEATALLAGDGLLTFAFEYITDFFAYKNTDAKTVLRIVNEIAKSAGCAGMIGGQVVDLECEGRSNVDEKTLTYLHNRKTGALIRVSVFAGAVSAGASDEQLQSLLKFSDNIGLAFQIQDDILDCVGDAEILGKPIGSDEENRKTTYVTLLGLERAKEKAESLTLDSINALSMFGDAGKFLAETANYLMKRKS